MRNYVFNKVERTRHLEKSHNRTPSFLGGGKVHASWGSPLPEALSAGSPGPPGSTKVSSPPMSACG